MKKVKSKLSTFMQNFVAIGLLILLTLLLCFTTNPFEKTQPKTIDAVSIIPDSTTMYEWNQDERGWYTYLGTYPQTYVGDELNTQLVSLLKSGALDDAATGNTYISNNRASKQAGYEEKQNKEYEYNGKLYVAVVNQQHTADGGRVTNRYFSTGDRLGNVGDTKFFKVEPIKWYIIDGTDPQTAPEGTQCRVISDLALNAMPFNATSSDGNVWRDSLIRQYLNGNFYQSTGLANEDVVILQHNQNNVAGDKTDGRGPATDDYVYFLSYQEINDGQFEFLDTDAERITTPTDFALSNGVSYIRDGAYYWLRSAAFSSSKAYVVNYDGSLIDNYVLDSTYHGVRPALTLDLDSMPEPVYEEADIYISTAEELKQLSDYSADGGIFNPNWKFYLTNDIDMSSIQDFVPLGGETVPGFGDFINPFTGYFNGQGHTISNLNFDMSLDYASLFAVVQDCTIVNLNLEYGEIAREYPGDKAGFGGLVSCCLADDVLISNVNVSIESLVNPPADGSGGLIGSVSIDNNSTVSITDCDVYIGRITAPLICGGMIGMMYYGSSGTLAISRCMVNVGTVDIRLLGEQYYGGVIGAVVEDRVNDRARNIVLNQVYVNMGSINAPESSRIGGLICFVVEPVVLTYNEVTVRADINCTNTADTYFGYEITDSSVEPTSVVGTNSYFNFTGNVAADFSGVGRYAGVFDVAREQYYSGFSDNEWVVFPNTHPTIREFMAIGDFAPIASVEDKLIELGYTRVM